MYKDFLAPRGREGHSWKYWRTVILRGGAGGGGLAGDAANSASPLWALGTTDLPFRSPRSAARSCHLWPPSAPGQVDGLTLYSNPEQPEGQRAPLGNCLGSTPWNSGLREEGDPGGAHLQVAPGDLRSFSGPQFPHLEKPVDSTQGQPPAPQGQSAPPVFTAGGPHHHLPSSEGNGHLLPPAEGSLVTVPGTSGTFHTP